MAPTGPSSDRPGQVAAQRMPTLVRLDYTEAVAAARLALLREEAVRLALSSSPIHQAAAQRRITSPSLELGHEYMADFIAAKIKPIIEQANWH